MRDLKRSPRRPQGGRADMDDVAPLYSGAVNPSYRQTARRDVCPRKGAQAGVEGVDRRSTTGTPNPSLSVISLYSGKLYIGNFIHTKTLTVCHNYGTLKM